MFETGDDSFLQLPRHGGTFETSLPSDASPQLTLLTRSVPVIVVFTKYDLLRRKAELTVDESLPRR